MDDQAEVSPDDDQMDPGVRSRAAPVRRERRTRRLRTVKEIIVVPVWATRVGVNPESAKVRAGGIVGTMGREEPEHPASRSRAAHARRTRLISRQATLL